METIVSAVNIYSHLKVRMRIKHWRLLMDLNAPRLLIHYVLLSNINS
jgi:hypothetical protein